MNRTNVRETIGALLGGCYATVTNRKHALIAGVFMLILGWTHTFGQQGGQFVLLGGVRHNQEDSVITPYKIEAAAALALELTGKLRLIPTQQRDSLVATRAGKDSLSVLQAADMLGAEIILFLGVQRVANLVRVEAAIVGGDGWIVTNTGVGYATITLADAKRGNRIADPALLAATQRALCGAMVDAQLYSSADSGFVVHQTRLTALGGFVFTSDPSLAAWSIMREKVAASYDIANTIASALRSHDSLTVVDLESRDSMYAVAGLHMVENYNPLSKQELRLLKDFEFTTVITGSVQRIKGGATVTVTVSEIQPDLSYTPLRSSSIILTVDSKRALQDSVRACLKDLFGSISEPREPQR